MSLFRDDRDAMQARLDALEHEAERADLLAVRVRELEAENRELRARLAAAPASALPPASAPAAAPSQASIYVDPRIDQYLAALVAATGDPSRAEDVLAGAGPADAAALRDAAIAIARQHGRPYVTPTDVKDAVRAVLPARIVVASRSTTTAAALVEQILDLTEVP